MKWGRHALAGGIYQCRRGAGWIYRRATGATRALPDFLIVGAQKAGTTMLYEHLCGSPLVCRARDKELHFFDWHYNYRRGLDWYRRCFPTQQSLEALRPAHHCRGITGEASPYYLFHPLAPERAAAALPEAKIIILLRNPIDRTLSHYEHAVRAGWEGRSLESAIDGEPERMRLLTEEVIRRPTKDVRAHELHSYLSQGMYEPLIQRWLSRWAPERVLILQSERYFVDAIGTMEEVQSFLGLPVHSVVTPGALNAGSSDRSTSPEIRSRLADFFAPHNEELFRLLGRRFDWR